MSDKDTGFQKKYGLFTAIAMVVGTLIGGGVFFKSEEILSSTGGNLPIGVLAWLIGGFVIIVCAYVFGMLAIKHEDITGVVGYSEVSCGRKYSYLFGWFMSVIYYPTLTVSLAYISARYTMIILGEDVSGGKTVAIAGFYLIVSFALNSLAPILAGKVQVTTTIIKLIPLIGMAVIGTIVGLHNGIMIQNFTTTVIDMPKGQALFEAIIDTIFAYEGWIIITTIHSELKNAKKNFPKALLIGIIITVSVYVLYYVGLAGSITNQEMMESGEQGVLIAFSRIFSSLGGPILMVFVLISCLGTLNGLMFGCSRGIYAMASRDMGPARQTFKRVDPSTDMATNSSIFGLLMCAFWFLYYYLANFNVDPFFEYFSFDITALPIITIYTLYIPIFVKFVMSGKNLSPIKRFVIPSFAIMSCLFMIFITCYVSKIEVVWYLILFVVFMAVGFSLKNSGNKSLK